MTNKHLAFWLPTGTDSWVHIEIDEIDEVSCSTPIQGDSSNPGLAERMLEEIIMELRFYLDFPHPKSMLRVTAHSPLAPDKSALSMALLLAQVYFSETATPELNILRNQQNVLQMGYDISKGIIALPVINPPISYVPPSDNTKQSKRNIQVIKLPETVLGYQALINHDISDFVKSLVPRDPPTVSVAYYPVVTQKELAMITVHHKPTTKPAEFTILGKAEKARRAKKLLNEHPDFVTLLNGDFLISFENANDRQGGSWHLAFVSAVNMAAGLQPKLDNVCIFTGQIAEGLCFSVSHIESKLENISLLKSSKCGLLAANGKEPANYDWHFYMSDAPALDDHTIETNYSVAQKIAAKGILIFPVELWQPNHLYGVT